MGMGEALANPHTFAALDLLTDPNFLNISPRRIPVSPVGFAPGLERLVAEHPRVTITLSVHSPFDVERGELIHLQHRFSLGVNLEILDRHVEATGRRVFLAYLPIKGYNDTDDHVDALTDLVYARSKPQVFRINVIAFNRAPALHRAGPGRRSPLRLQAAATRQQRDPAAAVRCRHRRRMRTVARPLPDTRRPEQTPDTQTAVPDRSGLEP